MLILLKGFLRNSAWKRMAAVMRKFQENRLNLHT